jgi:hypothetical protein
VVVRLAAIATPVLADDVGVRVGPVDAGVTVGESHDRDRDRDRTVIKDREPDRDRTTVIKKEHGDGDESKTTTVTNGKVALNGPFFHRCLHALWQNGDD